MELDRLFSLFVRQRVPFCENCGEDGSRFQLQCSHHISRGRASTRWDPDNAVTHCAYCHDLFTNNPALHHEWILHRLGQPGWDALMDKAYGPINENTGTREGPVRPDRVAILAWLKEAVPE